MIKIGDIMKKTIGKMDLWLLILMIAFSGFGLLMIFSASSVAAVLRNDTASSHFFVKQLGAVVGAFVIGFIFIINVPTKVYKVLTNIAMGAAVLSLIFVFSYGVIVNGSQSWYNFGIINFQPAELAKSIFIIFSGVYYYKLSKKASPKFAEYLVPLGWGGLMAFLIARQPDFGGAVIIAGIAGLLYLAVPMAPKIKTQSYKFIAAGVIILVVAFGLFGKNIFDENQLKRLTFQNPCSRYQSDTGYQVCNSYIAINNGGFFGLGLGDSTQKYLYLPEAHTDFIFPIIIEELGLIIGVFVLLCYSFLLYRILYVAKSTSNLQNSIIAYGIFLLFISHIFINLLGVLGLIPLTGVPLPFLSYGGSFNMNIIALLFIIQRINIENNIIKNKNEIKNI